MATDMLLHARRVLNIMISPSISRKKDCNFKREIDEKIEHDHRYAASIGPIELDGGDSFVVPFSQVTTARFLYIESDQDVSLIFNGGTESILLKPPKLKAGDTPRLGRILMDVEFTSLSISNPAAPGTMACVSGYLLGD